MRPQALGDQATTVKLAWPDCLAGRALDHHPSDSIPTAYSGHGNLPAADGMSPFIIAEVGINHNGSLQMAKRLIDVAQDCGADAVKFQKRTIDLVYSKDFLDSPRDSPWGTIQRAQKEGLEFGKDDYRDIDDHCKQRGIEWFASAWDVASYEFLREFELKYNKVASAMIVCKDLLEAIAADGKHTFISTGMGTRADIARAVTIFRAASCPFELMHCVSAYPVADREANLLAIPELKASTSVMSATAATRWGWRCPMERLRWESPLSKDTSPSTGRCTDRIRRHRSSRGSSVLWWTWSAGFAMRWATERSAGLLHSLRRAAFAPGRMRTVLPQ